MAKKFETLNVDPKDLRYTKKSIANHFRGGFLLEEAQRQIQSGTKKPSDFPPVNVYKDEKGVMWSNDNRRLAVFQKANVPKIEAKVHSEPVYRAPTSPAIKAQMSSPSFAPRIRGEGSSAKSSPAPVKGGGSGAKSFTVSKCGGSSAKSSAPRRGGGKK
eukprot:Gb_39760 [translate_table: standard]